MAHAESDTIDELILDRLDASSLAESAKDLVLAAMVGSDEFAAVLGGGAPPPRPTGPDAGTAAAAAGTYLDSIEVTGFRGIGPTATLRLEPGPGLTIVTGRNGSGKSSFAEAAEFALTGDNKRWSGRSAVWQDGWRNLHRGDEPRIHLHLGVEGRPNGATVECFWTGDGRLSDRTSYVQIAGERRRPVTDLGWDRALDLYRPFLSYAELGGLLSGKPSEMHDSLHRILGLDRLVDLERTLKSARKQADDGRKLADAALPVLRELLAAQSDSRARQAEALLAARDVDLDTVQALADDRDDADERGMPQLRQIEGMELPPLDAVTDHIDRLRAALAAMDAMAGTDAATARSVAGLLREALAHQAQHPGEVCPVCGGRALDAAWVAKTRVELDRLTREAAALDDAFRQIDETRRALRALVPAAPAALAHDLSEHGVHTADAGARWRTWDELLTGDDRELAARARVTYQALIEAYTPVRETAQQALVQRRQAWQPIALQLRDWVRTARQSRRARAAYTDLRAAVTWLQQVSDDIRNAQLAPVADAATGIWKTLRQDSNVELDAIRLAGTGTSRRVDLDVNVDGIPSAALGVMSQGELHSLALALFLPRATMAQSPFRFLVIDDPVQSMDPVKVYGLATVLADVAKQRQVIVFTHDDRLPAAVRQLQIPAHIVLVNRRTGSHVGIAHDPKGDPARRYLSDARAVTHDGDMSPQVKGVIVAGLVRDALESACHEAIRRRDFRGGVPIAETEAKLEGARRVRDLFAILVAGSASADVDDDTLRRRVHPAVPRVLKVANQGAHGQAARDLRDPRDLIGDAQRVTEALERL